MHFTFRDQDSYNNALKKYRKDSPGLTGLQYIITERPSSKTLILEYSEIALKEIRDYAVGQNLTTLRNRVNELGVSEPIVQRQGAARIVVQLPGVQDPTAAKKIIGKTANLEFRLEANSRTSSKVSLDKISYIAGRFTLPQILTLLPTEFINRASPDWILK